MTAAEHRLRAAVLREAAMAIEREFPLRRRRLYPDIDRCQYLLLRMLGKEEEAAATADAREAPPEPNP